MTTEKICFLPWRSVRIEKTVSQATMRAAVAIPAHCIRFAQMGRRPVCAVLSMFSLRRLNA